jgi:GxxExxY protein
MDLNVLTYDIRGAIFTVHKELGPGFLESVYEAALVYELKEKGFEIQTQVALPVLYKHQKLELGFRVEFW